METKDGNSTKKDLWEKISDAIPERHAGKVLVFFCAVALLGLIFNVYSTFWGNPRLRSKIKDKTAQVESLQKEMESSSMPSIESYPTDNSLFPSDDILQGMDSSTPDSVIFKSYSDSVTPIIDDIE